MMPRSATTPILFLYRAASRLGFHQKRQREGRGLQNQYRRRCCCADCRRIGATALVALLPRLLPAAACPKTGRDFVSVVFPVSGRGTAIQVALIQKFVLLLGHPAYALTVIVFSMLVASGAGSYWSRRIAGRRPRLIRALAATALLVAALAFGASPLVSAAAARMGLKMAVTALAIAWRHL